MGCHSGQFRAHQGLLLRYADGDHLLLLLINLGSLTRFAMNDPMVALERDRRWELMFCSERPKYGGSGVDEAFMEGWLLQPHCVAAARRSVIAAAVNERPDLRPVDLARRDRQERRSREHLARIQIGPEPESSGRQWRNHPLDFCRKGAVAEEMVERADVPADSADAVHLSWITASGSGTTLVIGGNTTSNDSSGNFRVAASICSSWMRASALTVESMCWRPLAAFPPTHRCQ